MMMPSGPRPDDGHDKEFMNTLAKGLAVLSAFGKQRPAMTLSDAAAVASLSRATARRVLRTLAQLGYVVQDGRAFSLAPRVLELGFAYLSGQDWIDRALPMMKEVSEQLGESCSGSILQGVEIVYVARVPARRIMSTALAVGSRLPAFYTSLGRAQLGYLDGAEIWRRLRSVPIEAYTPYTITDMQALYDRVRADREQGFSIVDEELEQGLRSIAVRCSTARARRSAPSISQRTPRAPPATKCARNSCPNSGASRSEFRKPPCRSKGRPFVLRRLSLSPRAENPIVPVRFPHSGSDIEQTGADTKKRRSNSSGGQDGKSDDNQGVQRNSSQSEDGENQRRRRRRGLRAETGKRRPDESYQAADRRGIY
jgi:IclR family transcriptional regulator, pca regulon regulatory protein